MTHVVPEKPPVSETPLPYPYSELSKLVIPPEDIKKSRVASYTIFSVLTFIACTQLLINYASEKLSKEFNHWQEKVGEFLKHAEPKTFLPTAKGKENGAQTVLTISGFGCPPSVWMKWYYSLRKKNGIGARMIGLYGHQPDTIEDLCNFDLFKNLTHITKEVLRTYELNGNRKITIVGHSLGGLSAIIAAKYLPEYVDKVIVAGIPLELKNWRKMVLEIVKLLDKIPKVRNAIWVRNTPIREKDYPVTLLSHVPYSLYSGLKEILDHAREVLQDSNFETPILMINAGEDEYSKGHEQTMKAIQVKKGDKNNLEIPSHITTIMIDGAYHDLIGDDKHLPKLIDPVINFLENSISDPS